MLRPVSSEFVALCRAQILLLTQAFGASISVVYLTGELAGHSQAQLVPIAAYPDLREAPKPGDGLSLLPQVEGEAPAPEVEPLIELKPRGAGNARTPALDGNMPSVVDGLGAGELVDQRRFVLPLIYEEVVFGLLVTRRPDRAWTEWEQTQIQEIAKTLAIACVMDQRYQWLGHERKQLQVLQAQQHDLMDNLLHQFRNSLTALQTFGKLILKRLIPGDRNHELASSISQETLRLRELAQQMEVALAATQLDRDPLALPFAGDRDGVEPTHEQLGEAVLDSLRPPPVLPIGLLAGGPLPVERCLVDGVLAPLFVPFRELAQAQDLTLKLELGEDLPPVWANPQALREVMNNLLENAIKYTPASGEITVWGIEDVAQSQVVLAVSDTGVGIPAADLPHIFERHYRGVQAQGEIAGSGLGLAIAKSLVEQMQGKIEVFSPALSCWLAPELAADRASWSGETAAAGGTTFVVRLAIALASQALEA